MRQMRPCATANAIACGLALVAAAFAACTAGSPAPPPPPVPPPEPAPRARPALGTAAPPAASTAAALPQAAPRPGCAELLSEITNEPPDGGVVMNNAMTASDAGATDRLQPMIDLMRSRRDDFRCCFDAWARENPGGRGRLVVVLEVDPSGALTKAAVDPASGIRLPDVEACVIDLARTLSYPRSPSGRETTLVYPFDVKARS